MVSIGKLNYELGLDTKDFVQGTKATQKEMRNVRRIMRETDTAAEKHEQKWQDIREAYRKGHISADRARRAMDKLHDEMREGNKVAGKSGGLLGGLKEKLAGLNPATLGAAAGATALAAAFRAADFASQQFFEALERIDKDAKLATALGISTAAIEGFEIAARRTAGATEEQVQTALRNMTARLSKAAQGTGEAAAAIEELGLSAEALAARPEAALGAIADALQSVEQQSDKLRIVQQIFGEENGKLVATLGAGSDALEAYREEAVRLGLALPEHVTSEVEALNDRMDEFNAKLEGTANIITGTVATEFNTWGDILDSIDAKLGGVTKRAEEFGAAMGRANPWVFNEAFPYIANQLGFTTGAMAGPGLSAATTTRNTLAPAARTAGDAERARRAQEQADAANQRPNPEEEVEYFGLFETTWDDLMSEMDGAATEYEKERANRKAQNEAMDALYEQERKTYEKQLEQIDKEIEDAKKAEQERMEHNKRLKASRDFDILVQTGTQRARTLELQARGFGPKKEVQQVRIADDQLQQLVEERETLVEMEDEVGRPV